ncbi:hypothetical protein GHT06_007198 [Daphnia sinensis]|uniref:Cryptochrome/DNA photolyase FAD-binding domain-containing protein n=1 Tax=Daphnia sinensis TaxID=1820382 RepID=A0AAD5KD83_9CRUS|nr:hypothetical protein GHT06_006623 [Daphnia sinensis]KAI9549398.1 hypothetical protein GHT06_007198 [Daphnia sinensis]
MAESRGPECMRAPPACNTTRPSASAVGGAWRSRPCTAFWMRVRWATGAASRPRCPRPPPAHVCRRTWPMAASACARWCRPPALRSTLCRRRRAGTKPDSSVSSAACIGIATSSRSSRVSRNRVAQHAPGLRRLARRRLERHPLCGPDIGPHRLAHGGRLRGHAARNRLAQLPHAGHAGVGGGLPAVARLAARGPMAGHPISGLRARHPLESAANAVGHHRINTTRVYNPIKQAQDHDPKGIFVRRWLPHMRRVPDTWLFEPWLMPPEVQRHCGLTVGSGPTPTFPCPWWTCPRPRAPPKPRCTPGGPSRV